MSRSCPNYSYQIPRDWKDRGIETVRCSQVRKGPWKRDAGICPFSHLRNTEIDFNTREALARRARTGWLRQSLEGWAALVSLWGAVCLPVSPTRGLAALENQPWALCLPETSRRVTRWHAPTHLHRGKGKHFGFSVFNFHQSFEA